MRLINQIITAVSKDLINITKLHFKINKDIKMIPNFIDLDLYSQIVDEKLRSKIAKKHEKILVHISNFRKVKRVEDVIKIFNKVKKKILQNF